VDKKATFNTAIKESERSIYKIAAVYTNSVDDKNDLVQEIVYQLWKSYDTFNNASSIHTWIYRVAMNVAIYQLKASKKRVDTVSLHEMDLGNAATEPDESEERWRMFRQHVDKLNLLDKGIVMLYLEDKSYEEIGEIIGISASNDGTKLSRIREKLKSQINQ
jgi:RNA polymerase sigma factor (sigma-70 family)